MPKDTKTLCIKKGCASVLTQPLLLCNRLFIGLSFPLHSLSSLANPSYGNLVLSKSSQFKHAGYGDTRFC